jgi:hypothetical protein
MNNFSRKVLDKAQKSDAKCVASRVSMGGGDETACVDQSSEPKTEKAEAKLLSKFDELCAPNPPPWGVNAGKCCENGPNDGDSCMVDATCSAGTCVRGACISGARKTPRNQATHDLFGSTVVVTDGDATGKCQKGIIKRTGKLLVEHWRTFRKCKKDNFNSIMNDAGWSRRVWARRNRTSTARLPSAAPSSTTRCSSASIKASRRLVGVPRRVHRRQQCDVRSMRRRTHGLPLLSGDQYRRRHQPAAQLRSVRRRSGELELPVTFADPRAAPNWRAVLPHCLHRNRLTSAFPTVPQAGIHQENATVESIPACAG